MVDRDTYVCPKCNWILRKNIPHEEIIKIEKEGDCSMETNNVTVKSSNGDNVERFNLKEVKDWSNDKKRYGLRNNMKSWTPKNVATLKRVYGNYKLPEIAYHLGKTANSILPKLRELNLSNIPSWESKHGLTISRIANEYDSLFPKELKRRTTVNGEIDVRTDRGSLHNIPNRQWVRDDERKLLEQFDVLPIFTVAYNLGRTCNACIQRAYNLKKSVSDSYDYKRGLNTAVVGKVFDEVFQNTGVVLKDINDILKRSDESIFRTKFYYDDGELENEVAELKALWRRGETVFSDYGKSVDRVLSAQPVAEVKTESKTESSSGIGFKMVSRWVDINKEIEGKIKALMEDSSLKRALEVIDFVDKETEQRFQVEIIVRNVKTDQENYKMPNNVLEL